MEEQNRMTGHLKSRIGEALGHGFFPAVCCLVSFKITTYMLANAWFVSRDDILLGGMWAVVATIFVFRYGCKESAGYFKDARLGRGFAETRIWRKRPEKDPGRESSAGCSRSDR